MNPIPVFPVPTFDEQRLAYLVNDPSTARSAWTDRAACTSLPDGLDTYFPEDGELPSIEALAGCLACPVAHECLATALIHEATEGYRFGWWGGFGPDERESLADRLGISTVPVTIELRQPADLAKELRAKNRTIPSIAAELGCTERTVYRYLARRAA